MKNVAARYTYRTLVWFYGGSFLEGCAAWYDATNLAAITGAVVVAANYRLSALGYLGLPEQLEDGSANAGLRDMQWALRWVRGNAAAFGGDSGRVTIFGQVRARFRNAAIRRTGTALLSSPTRGGSRRAARRCSSSW